MSATSASEDHIARSWDSTFVRGGMGNNTKEISQLSRSKIVHDVNKHFRTVMS